MILISDEEGEDNFPNSQIFDCNIFPKEEIQIKDEYGFDQDNSLDECLDNDNDSIICEDDYDNLNRWIEVLSQEKKSVDMHIIKVEPIVDYDSISKTIDDEDLDLVLNKEKINEDEDEELIEIPERENLIQIPVEKNLIQIPEEENLIQIPVEENLIQIPLEKNLIQIPEDEKLIKSVEDQNLTNKQITPSSSSISETLTKEINERGDAKNSYKKQNDGIKLISPLPLIPRNIESKDKKEIKSKKSTNESANKTKKRKSRTPRKNKKSSSSESIDKKTKLEIMSQRKEKLKNLALHNLEANKNVHHKIHPTEIKIKNTKKSRGDILTEEFLSKASTSTKNDVDKKSSKKSTNITAIKKNKTTKKTRKSSEIKSKSSFKASGKSSSSRLTNDCTEVKVNAIKETLIPLVPDISLPPITKKSFSENLNILDGEKRISLIIGTNIGFINGKTTKRVQFKEAIIREYLIDDGCYLTTATKNAKLVEKNAPLIKKNQNEINTKASSLSLDVIADIMGWKVSWLNVS